jgi:hypothetical protein
LTLWLLKGGLFAKLTPVAARTLAPTSRLTALSNIAAQVIVTSTFMLKAGLNAIHQLEKSAELRNCN